MRRARQFLPLVLWMTTVVCVSAGSRHLLMARHRSAVAAAGGTYVTDDPDDLMQYCLFWHEYDADADPQPDASGNGKESDLTASGTTWNDYALEYDGSTGGADVDTPNSSDYDNWPFTIMVWVKSDDTDTEVMSPTIWYGVPDNVYGDAWMLGVSDDQARFNLLDGGGSVDIVTYDSDFTTWRHVAVVATASNHYLYVDGIQRDGDTSVRTLNMAGSRTLRIGNRWNAPYAGFLDGTVDDTSFFQRAFTSNEVYNASQFQRTE